MAQIKKLSTELQVKDKLLDTSGDAGTSGQILSSTGTGTNWINATTTDSTKVAKDGDTMTGNLTISKNAPTITLNNTAGGGLDPLLQASGTNFFILTTSITPLTLALDTGNVTFAGDLTVEGGDIQVGGSGQLNLGDDSSILSIGRSNEIWTQNTVNADATLYLNYRGYNNAATRFRSFDIRDGKGAQIAVFSGPSKLTTLQGGLNVNYGGSSRLSISGDVSVVGATDFAIPQGRKLLLDGAGGHTYIEEESDSNLKFYVGGSERMNITGGTTYSQQLELTRGNQFTINNNASSNYNGIHIKNDTDAYSGAVTFWTEYGGTDTNVARVHGGTNGSNGILYLQVANTSKALTTALSLDYNLNAIFANNVSVTGDLTVNGTTTTVNSTNLDLSDNIIGLNRGASSNANDSGLIIERGSTGDNAAFVWDESIGYFSFGTTQKTPSATGAVANESDWTWKPIKASGAVFTGAVTIDGVNDTYNFKAMATDTDSWFGVYEDANNSANIAVIRSDSNESFKVLGHQGNMTLGYSTSSHTINGTTTFAGSLSITGDGSNAVTFTETGAGKMTIAAPDDIVLDAESDIILDANGADIRLKKGGTEYAVLTHNNPGLTITTSETNSSMYLWPNGTGNVYALTDTFIITATEGEIAKLLLRTDEGDDNGDDWYIQNHTNNNLLFTNDRTGSQLANLTLTPQGPSNSAIATFAGNIVVGNRVENGAGNAAGPSYTFDGFEDDGMYKEVYDTTKSQVSFATEGTRRGRIGEFGIWSEANIYASSQFRSFNNPWYATAGTSGAGFLFRNTADSNDLLNIDGSGNATFAGDVLLGDGQKAKFGDNPDLQIYHNGSHSFIQDVGAGDLRLLASSIKLQNTSESNILTLASDLSAAFAGSVTVTNNLTVNGADSSFDTGNNGTFVTKDTNDYPRITVASASAQLGLFRSNNAVGGMYIGGNETGFRIFTEGFSQKFHLDQSGNATFAGDIKQSTRTTLHDNGTITWGAANDYGNLTWDTGYALVGGLSGKGLKLFTNGGSGVALTIDTSQNATFAGSVHLDSDSAQLQLGDDNDMQIFHNGANGEINNGTGDFTIDSAGDINLDADGGDIRFKDGGTIIGAFANSSSNFVIKAGQSDKDIFFQGVDGGSNITALTLDMSSGGTATFNNELSIIQVIQIHILDFSKMMV